MFRRKFLPEFGAPAIHQLSIRQRGLCLSARAEGPETIKIKARARTSKTQRKQSGDDDKFYHGKGINDLNAIGDRNVGCNRGLFNWYSLDSQVKMGQQFAQQVEQTSTPDYRSRGE